MLALQAKQQRHEHDLYELKIKAEREALEAQLQLEENRQRMTRVGHAMEISADPFGVGCGVLLFLFFLIMCIVLFRLI